MIGIVVPAAGERFLHQRPGETLPTDRLGDRDAADLDAPLVGERDQPQTAGERVIDAKHQMLRALVEAVEIGIGAVLLDDKDRLPKAQQLVQQHRAQLIEPAPGQARPAAASHARLVSRSILMADL